MRENQSYEITPKRTELSCIEPELLYAVPIDDRCDEWRREFERQIVACCCETEGREQKEEESHELAR